MTHDTTVTSKRHTFGKKHKTTIRVEADFWREFVEDCHRKGVRTCSVLEALGKAWLYGGAMVPGLGRPQSINLTIKRVLKIPDAQKGVEAKMAKKKKTNHYDRTGYWYFDPELEPGEIVVEQPREWPGEEKGFTWVESRRLWWKKE